MGAARAKCNYLRGLNPKKNTQSTAPKANTTTNISAAASDAYIGAHRGLDRLAICATGDQGKPSRNQQDNTENLHHANAFHRLIWART